MARRSSVALHYDSRLPAPLVVARGKGELAERMNALAREHGIPVVDAPEVAEALVLADPGIHPRGVLRGDRGDFGLRLALGGAEYR